MELILPCGWRFKESGEDIFGALILGGLGELHGRGEDFFRYRGGDGLGSGIKCVVLVSKTLLTWIADLGRSD